MQEAGQNASVLRKISHSGVKSVIIKADNNKKNENVLWRSLFR